VRPVLMSHVLWKSYWDNDVDKLRRLLAPGGYSAPTPSKSAVVVVGSQGSPASYATSPRPTPKWRKASGATGMGKAEVNSRDHAGLTILLRASSSTEPHAIVVVQALLDHPAVDLHVQDPESGWNALHRALYAGNISIARLLLSHERSVLTGQGLGGSLARVGQLIKTKDHEGNSPFDVYNYTVEGGTADDLAVAGDSESASTSSGGEEANGFVPP
jgi:inhibitor of Bruton tyrosine kinase